MSARKWQPRTRLKPTPEQRAAEALHRMVDALGVAHMLKECAEAEQKARAAATKRVKH